MSAITPSEATASVSVAGIVAERAVRSAFQPVVALDGNRVVGYEALARGPAGSALERPDRLFAAGREEGLVAELEWECRRAAFRGALDAGLGPSRALFVNVEPSLVRLAEPDWLSDLVEEARGRLAIFVELTERALTDHPTELLLAVDRMRELGLSVALDDVGADPRSLALMPFLAPEMIKLDLRLVQRNPSRRMAEIFHAVNAQAERTGAMVLAEGIETEAHLERALAFGAQYGQGWLFGRPGALPESRPAGEGTLVAPRRIAEPSGETPFALVAKHRPIQRGDKRLLVALSRQIEEQAAAQGAAAVVLSTFQDIEYFTPASAARYSAMAVRAAMVGALGVGMPSAPAPGVRGVRLDEAEALRGEWNVTVMGPHFAMAFVAMDLGDTGPDMERRFDFALTYDRDLVVRASAAMMRRVASP